MQPKDDAFSNKEIPHSNLESMGKLITLDRGRAEQIPPIPNDR